MKSSTLGKKFVTVPILFMLSFGVTTGVNAAGVTAYDSVIYTQNLEAFALPVVQTSALDSEINENIAATMSSLAKGVLSKEAINLFGNDDSGGSKFKLNNVWNALEPYIDIDLEDPAIVSAITGSNVPSEKSREDAKRIIIYNLASSVVHKKHFVDNYSGRVFEYSSIKKLDSGNIYPRNQNFLHKDERGVIESVPLSTDYTFNSDGTKVVFGEDFMRDHNLRNQISKASSDSSVAISVLNNLIKEDGTVTEKRLRDKINNTIFKTDVSIEYDESKRTYVLTIAHPDNPSITLTYDSLKKFDEKSEFLLKNSNILKGNALQYIGILGASEKGLDNIYESPTYMEDLYTLEYKKAFSQAVIDKENSTFEISLDGKPFVFNTTLESSYER